MPITATIHKPPHPLAGAFERVARAEGHHAELKRAVAQFGKENEEAFVAKLNPENPNKVVIQRSMLMPPLRFSILVGEISYNLRGALDYLIYELAQHDSGVIQDGTQFPIEDRKDGFDRNADRFLKGVNVSHRTRIEDLQPYKGCSWTRDLLEISNPDKHRKLTSVGAATEQLVTIAVGSSAPLDPNGGTIKTIVRADGTEVHMQVSPTVTEIQLDDGTLILEALDVLQSQVAGTLEAFKPEFGVPSLTAAR
jgi:hypothetical protein